MNKKKTRLTDTRFAALATIVREGVVEWPQIKGYDDHDAVVTRTYADLVKLGLIENHYGYSHRLTEAGKTTYNEEYLARHHRLANEVFVLSENYGPALYTTAYESFPKVKAATEAAIERAAVEYFGSPSLFDQHDDRDFVARKVASVVAKAKKASSIEALEHVAKAVFKVDSDNWHYGAKIQIDRIPIVLG